MKKRSLIIIIAIVLLSGLFIYSARIGSLKVYSKNSIATTAKQNSSEHEGHTPDTEPPKAKSETVEEQETPTIEIPPEKQQLIGVKTAEVSVKPLRKIIRTVGRIEYDERKIATVNTKIEGWVERLYVDYTGRYVKKGEALAEIFSPELIATQQELINALKWETQGKEIRDGSNPTLTPLSKNAEGGFSVENMSKMFSADAAKLFEASKQRLRLWDINEEQIKKIEETGKPIRTLTIYSPVSGYVVQKMALQGMKVMPGEKLFDVADLSIVWILADIYEHNIFLVKPGQSAKITLSYSPDKEFFSRIDYIYPTISTATRTAKVRFEIPNYRGQLKPQMFTNIEIKIDLGKKLAIPDDAVIDTGTRQIVYVDKGDGYFEPREVKLGVRAEGLSEIIMGLKAGEKVAASATFLIDSEAQLKGVTPLGGHKH
ncbi:MAG: efflux RND transporter periplasmic adaptor subunit [Thermodesulfovibrionales bacterium]|nr:efflux RND transporter periplasmic adaptor subunit [Thermodesulfovibrionales bacterium]